MVEGKRTPPGGGGRPRERPPWPVSGPLAPGKGQSKSPENFITKLLTYCDRGDILLISTKRELSGGGNPVDAQALGRRLAALRGSQSLEEAALYIGVTPHALAQYEAGLRVPRDEVKLRLSRYYGLSLEQLFFDPQVHVS